MKPYYQDPNKEATIYHQDCISGMNELAEGVYDLAITSPPYGIGKKYEENQSFGEWLKLISDFYTASFRIIKKGGYAIIVFADYYMFGGSKTRVQPMAYLHHLIAERAGWVHQCTRVWQKDFATLVDPYTISGNLPKLEYEFVATFRKPGGGREKVREQQYHPRAIWSTSGKRQATSTLKLHTAAFPEHLVVMILNVYSDPGDTVIDPFMGSGTTLAVAKRMGRRGIGFELGEEYCETSRVRICQQVFG
ncbi:unnamed protein product, partial [marine sediment metagenome]